MRMLGPSGDKVNSASAHPFLHSLRCLLLPRCEPGGSNFGSPFPAPAGKKAHTDAINHRIALDF
jgi:hypothetical protein